MGWVKYSDPRGMNQSPPKKLEKAASWRRGVNKNLITEARELKVARCAPNYTVLLPQATKT